MVHSRKTFFLPAQPFRDETNAEGGEHASNGEDGNRQRPEGGEGRCGDGLSIPMHPCRVVVLLDDLQGNITGQREFIQRYF